VRAATVKPQPMKGTNVIRYIILIYVRPANSESMYYDPSMITVTARDDETAIQVAFADALERGWEANRASIVRKEPIQ